MWLKYQLRQQLCTARDTTKGHSDSKNRSMWLKKQMCEQICTAERHADRLSRCSKKHMCSSTNCGDNFVLPETRQKAVRKARLDTFGSRGDVQTTLRCQRHADTLPTSSEKAYVAQVPIAVATLYCRRHVQRPFRKQG